MPKVLSLSLSVLCPPPRNCSDYDLCQSCEVSSQTVHPRTHVFLKIKTPLHTKTDQPLLRSMLYQQEGPRDMAAVERSEKASEKIRRHHHHHHHHPKSHHHDPMMGGFVSRSREQLREEMKQRRKVDKKRPQPDHVSSSKPRGKAEGTLTEKDKACSQKGHGK